MTDFAIEYAEAVHQALSGTGARVRTSVISDTREELVASRGVIESELRSTSHLCEIGLSLDDRTVHVITDLDRGPATAVDEALWLLSLQRPLTPRESPRLDRSSVVTFPGRSSTISALDLRDEVARLTAFRGEALVEARASQSERWVVSDDGTDRSSFRTTSAVLEMRVITEGLADRRNSLSRIQCGSNLHRILCRDGVNMRKRTLADAELPLERNWTDPWPEMVEIDGQVAAELLALFAESLSGESILEARSCLEGAVGELVSSPNVTIIDDPKLAVGPTCAPIDAEGQLTERRTLIEGGVLRAYLGTVATERELPQARAGNAWQDSPELPPRPNPSNLYIASGDEPLPASTLTVLQARGSHMSNRITGDFALSVLGRVAMFDGDRLVDGLTLGGNIFDFFRSIVAVGDRISWVPGPVGHYGSPDIQVRGLKFGTETGVRSAHREVTDNMEVRP